MKHTSIISMKYLLTTLVVTLFFVSCGVEESTSPSGEAASDYVSFALSNSGGLIDTTTPLSRAGTYVLTINPTSGTPIQTANYDISFSPVGAITGIATNTNSLRFRVNNTDATSVTITAKHKDNPAITKTLTLNFAPQVESFMNFALTNGSGTVDIKTPLARAISYGLTINPTSETSLKTANYDISFSPAGVITGIATNTNSLRFRVNNTAATSVTIIATHKENPVITKTLTLNFAPQVESFMNFALTNGSGTVDIKTSLSRASTYGLTIKPTSETSLKTANYDISFSPAGVITGIATNTNSLRFRVNNTDATSVTIIATHKENPAITKTLTLNFAPRADFMSFALTNGSGTVDIKTPLSRASTYGLTIKPTSETLLQTADYDIAFSPVDAITINDTRSSTNVLNFTVNNSDATSVTITATHKDNPVISKTLELTLEAQAEFMSFTVSNIEGALLTTDTVLIYRSNYMVSITPTDKPPLPTADYDIAFSPESAITRTAISTNSISFTVNDGSTTVTITATHKNNSAITKTLSLTFKPRADFMSFVLTNRSGTLAPTTPLARASSYGVSVKREDGADEKTEDYTFSVSPADAITIDIRRSNSIDFTVKNTADMTVSITAIHKDDTSIVETLVLDLAPPANFMNFAVSNVGGLLLGTTTPLTHGKRYMVSITPTSASPLQSADYDIAFSPESAITGLATNANSISFRVNDGTTTLTISATHKDRSAISNSLSLSFVRDYMSFTLTNRSGTVDTATVLARYNSYGLSVRRESGAPLLTADYTFSVRPTDAIRVDVRRTNAIDFTVNNTSDMAVTITATHKDDASITETLVLSFAPQVVDFMSFTLSDSGDTVPLATPLSRAGTYLLTINPSSETTFLTANYDITFSPVGAIIGIATNTNALRFIVNNNTTTSVTITATHKNNPVIRKTLTLNFAPQVGADFVSFTLRGSGGVLPLATELARAGTYVLSINPSSETILLTANYDITFSPVGAIIGIATNTNALRFIVNNNTTTSVTITATHKNNPVIRKTLTLNFAPQVGADFVSFTLRNSGDTVPLATPLSRAGTYVLSINPTSETPLRTADYDIIYTPADVITINNSRSSSNVLDFTVNNIPDMAVTITATHKNNPVITKTLRLNLASPVVTGTFQQDIENATVMPNLVVANALTREVLTPLGVPEGTPLVKRYATESGGGTKDGSSWANAWAATDLRNNINAISDAAANKVYLIMIAGGNYKPTSGNDRTISFSMKNYVAIMGGFKAGGGWEGTGITVFSGDIGTAGSIADNSYNVFNHTSIALGNSHLYGVTIINGNGNGSAETSQGFGGGMYNDGSSPNLTRVIFSGNSAVYGGGMYNNSTASPVLNRMEFSGNNGQQYGGGMVNDNNTSPVINNSVFSGNTAANNGGGMYNFYSSPVINNTVFSGNTAANNGGGMYNFHSSPVIVGAVFTGNRAVFGAGMINDNHGRAGPRILNTIFSGNIAGGSGPDIAMDFSGTGAENITIAGSVLGTYLTTGQPTNAIVGFNGSGNININYHHLKNGAVNFGADATTGGLTYPTIGAGSSAINLGLYVRRSGTTYYFSEDNANWYTGFSATGGWGSRAILPMNTEDLTTRDIAGKARTGRPDAGVFEIP